MGSKMIWRSTDKLKLRRGNTFSATDGLITEDSSMTLSDSNAKIYAVDTSLGMMMLEKYLELMFLVFQTQSHINI